MNSFLIGLLIGVLISFILVPVGLWVYTIIKNTLERREIKRMIFQKQILKPMDERDYNVKAWEKDIQLIPGEKEKLTEMFVKEENKDGE